MTDKTNELEFETYFEEFRWRIEVVCRGFLDNKDEVEDAVMETFQRAWKALASFDPHIAPLDIWLKEIARRVCISTIRRRQTVVNHQQELGEQFVRSREAHDNDLRIDIERCLSTLAPDERMVLMLRTEGCYTLSEVALRLGSTLSKVRTQEANAVKRMRTCLEVSSTKRYKI